MKISLLKAIANISFTVPCPENPKAKIPSMLGQSMPIVDQPYNKPMNIPNVFIPTVVIVPTVGK